MRHDGWTFENNNIDDYYWFTRIWVQTVSGLAALLSLIMLCMIACPCKGENTMGNCCGSKCVRIGALVLNVLTFVGAVWLMATGEHRSAAKRFYDMNTDDYYDRAGDDYYDDEHFTFAYTKEIFNNGCDENRKTRESDLSDDDWNDGCSETGGWALILGLVCTIFSSLLGILTLAKIIPAIEPDATSAKPSCACCCSDEMEAPQVLPEIPLTFVETRRVETGEKFGGFNDNL